jgi:hypothetical protein
LQLGCGLVTLDYLATVDAYPRPDDKIRSGELQVTMSFFLRLGHQEARRTIKKEEANRGVGTLSPLQSSTAEFGRVPSLRELNLQ